jgi:hypothetical protein
MTAEIAILNKTAVALAADSAVTIQVGQSEKIYNTVNKIFELNNDHPVGVMIYGGLEFMGIPLETLVKLYRSKRSGRSEKTIEGYSEDFLSYLENEVAFSDEDRHQHVRQILYAKYTELWEQIRESGQRFFATAPRFSRPKFNQMILIPQLEMEIETLENMLPTIGFEGVREAEFFRVYEADHQQAVQDAFAGWPLTIAAQSKLKRICGLALRRASLSKLRTGLVFAGFGDDEIFPTVRVVEIDGIICHKLKKIPEPPVEVGKTPNGAEVLPFAQREMVDRFLDGVDPDYDRYIITTMRRSLNNFGSTLVNQHFSGSATDKKTAVSNMRKATLGLIRDFNDKSREFKKTRFKGNILDMVRFMPKQDLAHMAESLVNLTSIKRKVSAEKETVGGPIDIAVISKTEGFVWIKRKHYFDREFNPGFFARHFRA